MKRCLFLSLSIIILFFCFSIHQNQVQSSSAYVVKPQYEMVQNFSEGLAAVFMEERWGYIDKQGNEVIPLSYDYALPFREGLAAVSSHGRWGFIDKTGSMIIEPQFELIDIQPDDIGGFSEGLASVSINDRWGFIDKSGKIVIEPQYGYAFSFSDGLAAVSQHDQWGYINKQGDIVIEPIYEIAMPFSEGAAAVYDDGWGFINKVGDAFTGFIYSLPSSFKDGLAPVDDGFINMDGILVIDFSEDHYYDMADSFYDGVAVVYKIMQREFYYGFMDSQGKEMVAPQFPFTRQIQFSEGLGAVYEEGLWGFIDRSGQTIITPQFEDITGSFSEGLVGIMVDGKWGFIASPLSASASTEIHQSPSSWAVQEVEAANKFKLVPEHLNQNYTAHINRQEFSELIIPLLSVIEGLTVDEWMASIESKLNKDVFDDTNHPMVLAAYELGIINGKGQRKFEPYSKITRQEAAVMLQRTALILEMRATPLPTSYADQLSIANWAQDGVMFISALKDQTFGIAVMNGVSGNRFDPEGTYTREQAIITIKRLFQISDSYPG